MDSKKKSKIGIVLRHSGNKTAVVEVERLVKHAAFKKYIIRRKRFHVHDAANKAAAGDKVRIIECRPISRLKRWRLESILEKAK